MQSISRRGNCYDNAHAESFWSRLKTALLAGGSFRKLSEERLEISHYIAYYNAERRHSALGYLAPNYIEALAEAPRSGGPSLFDGPPLRGAVTALACTPVSVGHSRWTLHLAADKAVALRLVDTILHETVSQVLKKTSCGLITSNTGVWGQ